MIASLVTVLAIVLVDGVLAAIVLILRDLGPVDLGPMTAEEASAAGFIGATQDALERAR
jgi:TRAP-type mannitol/chloroaromatic compound transport system permease large subunit